jgi:hypothetical protein
MLAAMLRNGSEMYTSSRSVKVKSSFDSVSGREGAVEHQSHGFPGSVPSHLSQSSCSPCERSSGYWAHVLLYIVYAGHGYY